uniref:RNA helicase n=1 Tax=Nicotiana tabacum TaxID=4097 RepID=A0A1S4CUD5_TOBAC|nr:PREDICTED: DEAD-box ATP-dependent RNA helicase 57-like [Nicotiana tabacum]
MEKDASFLFGGITFNRKKFATDFDRFKEHKTRDNSLEKLEFVENEKSEMEDETNTRVGKKRKRKEKGVVPDSVDGFSVFKNSKLQKESASEENDQSANELLEGKKEYYRQLERDAIFRKLHGIHASGSNVPSPLHSFAELRSRYKCRLYLLRNLAELGFKEPTPIQRQAIPVLLSVVGHLTAIFLDQDTSNDGVRAVILSPTKELAAQTTRECRKLAKGKKFYIRLMTKKLAKSGDFSKLRCDILISTPLRLQFAIRKGKLDLSRVEFLVLDESDKLFEPGLLEQVDFVVNACTNPSILRSLFSATLPDIVEDRARTIMHDAVRVIIGRKNSASETIKQKLVFVGSEEGKLLALRQSFAERLSPPVLVFVQNKERAKELYDELKLEDFRADVIHSDLSQTQRENAVDNFRAGKTWVLIATDVVSRGMDFKGVNCVINYDFPDAAAAYIHRIGRTGRAGRRGEAITFYTEADIPFLRNIANVITSSGGEVPEWIMSMTKKQWKKHRPQRETISTQPDI